MPAMSYSYNAQIYEDLFKKFDTDNSGAVEIDEIKAALTLLKVKYVDTAIQQLFALLQTNGLLDKKQFQRFIYICQNCDFSDLPALLFMAADTDFNGSIDKDELYAIMHRVDEDITMDIIQQTMELIGEQDYTLNFKNFEKYIRTLMQ